MKKLKLLGLLAMMLVVATVLCACGTLGNLNKVFNKDFDVTEKLFKEAAEIEDLKDFALIASNDDFAVFAKDKEQKVYNFRTNEVAETYKNDDDATYAISLLAGMPAYCVTKTTEDVVSKEYYDATGENFANVEDVEKEIGAVKTVGDKLLIINAVAYIADLAEGKLEEKGAVPAYVSIDKLGGFNGEYFYAITEGYSSVIIYDIDFTPVAIWNAPSYAAESTRMFILNNGAVLVQYSVVLDEDAKKFDYYMGGDKYDLVSLVINTKGKVKDVDLDYVVMELNANSYYYDDAKTEEENAFTDKFENIAVIARIEDQKIDANPINWDLVLMNNSGKAQKSLKLVDGQIVYDDEIILPTKLTADLFEVKTVYGTAIINNKGKVQFAATADVNYFGGYFYVAGRAIYDLEFNVVYDLIENDAAIIGMTGNTIFVTATTEKKDDAAVKTETLAFIGGAAEGEVVDTWEKDGKNDKIFKIESSIDGYSIYDPEAKTYTYYAADMTELLEVEAEITYVASGNDGDVAIFSVKDDDGVKYYAFTK